MARDFRLFVRRRALRAWGGLLAVATAFGVAFGPPVALGADPAAPASTASHAPAKPFPLRLEPGRRYLVDAAGRPFFIKADAAWSLIAQLQRPDLERYLAARQRQGYNALLVELQEHKFSSHAPLNAYGVAPFLRPGDFTAPNDAYFEYADEVIRRAAAHGMLVMLTPAYLGYDGGDEGWYRDLSRLTSPQLREYGRYVARRLGANPNLLWVHGGDYLPPNRIVLREVAEGIREVAGPGLHTFHGSRGHSALGFLGPGEPWLNVNTIYSTEYDVIAKARAEYARSAMPFFLIEARYENEKGAGDEVVRRQAYQALLSGACGHTMGNKPVWDFSAGWQAALDSPGARSMQQFHRLLDALPWWTLAPDLDHRVLVAGAGSGAEAVAAADPAGALALVYVPSPRAVTIDLRRLHGPQVDARWFDPVSGRERPVAGSPLSSDGLRVFSPDGANAGGAEDWVLVLRSVR